MHTSFNKYHLSTQLGRKSLRDVYIAYPIDEPEHEVVLKVFDASCLPSNYEYEDFVEKANFIKQLNHQYIVPVLDIGIEEGEPYVVSEYLPYGSLRSRMDNLSSERMDLSDVLQICLQLGQALSYAHQFNIIHGDIKPDNILFDADGNALLADFSLVGLIDINKLDYKSDAHGISYMAPEQFISNISEKSDQYAFACIIYELLTGHVPFTAHGFSLMWLKHSTDAPVAPSKVIDNLPKPVEVALLKALASDPAERHEDVASFIEPFRSLSLPLTSTFPFTHAASATETGELSRFSSDEASALSRSRMSLPKSSTTELSVTASITDEESDDEFMDTSMEDEEEEDPYVIRSVEEDNDDEEEEDPYVIRSVEEDNDDEEEEDPYVIRSVEEDDDEEEEPYVIKSLEDDEDDGEDEEDPYVVRSIEDDEEDTYIASSVEDNGEEEDPYLAGSMREEEAEDRLLVAPMVDGVVEDPYMEGDEDDDDAYIERSEQDEDDEDEDDDDEDEDNEDEDEDNEDEDNEDEDKDEDNEDEDKDEDNEDEDDAYIERSEQDEDDEEEEGPYMEGDEDEEEEGPYMQGFMEYEGAEDPYMEGSMADEGAEDLYMEDSISGEEVGDRFLVASVADEEVKGRFVDAYEDDTKVQSNDFGSPSRGPSFPFGSGNRSSRKTTLFKESEDHFVADEEDEDQFVAASLTDEETEDRFVDAYEDDASVESDDLVSPSGTPFPFGSGARMPHRTGSFKPRSMQKSLQRSSQLEDDDDDAKSSSVSVMEPPVQQQIPLRSEKILVPDLDEPASLPTPVPSPLPRQSRSKKGPILLLVVVLIFTVGIVYTRFDAGVTPTTHIIPTPQTTQQPTSPPVQQPIPRPTQQLGGIPILPSVTATGTETVTATGTSLPLPTAPNVLSPTVVASPTVTLTPAETPTPAPTPTETPTPAPTRIPVVPTPTPTPVPQIVLTYGYQDFNQFTNLTAEGILDWKQWGFSKATDVDHKAGVSPQISNFTLQGNGNIGSDHVNPINFAWSDGTPIKSLAKSVGAVYVTGLNNGFRITIPASATTRTLRLYVGACLARGLFTASLNGITRIDGSLDMTHDPKKVADNALYTITFSSSMPNQQMTITYTEMNSNGNAGYILLEAATLQ